jgi:hypothetical protein
MKTYAISVLLIVMLVIGCEVKVGSVDVSIDSSQHFSAESVEVRAPGIAPLLRK